jgi:uncharacterized DUF497 family protein
MNSFFIWDVWKSVTNYEKHGVSFEEATTVFRDPAVLAKYDWQHSGKEDRWGRIGVSSQGRLIAVFYTLRRFGNGEEEKVRIISARPASRKERQAYSRQRD